MNILFRSKKLEKVCNDKRLSTQEYGAEIAKKLHQRLNELRASETLANFCRLPAPRCHALSNNRAGKFAADLKHPFRLILEPAENPLPRKRDGGVDLSKITTIRILEVVDYHGE